MATRKELGIPDEKWIKLRDKCWIQNLWSASITPKGAFFCEVAAAMDMTLNGPGGWPIEPGWWKRKPLTSPTSCIGARCAARRCPCRTAMLTRKPMMSLQCGARNCCGSRAPN